MFFGSFRTDFSFQAETKRMPTRRERGRHRRRSYIFLADAVHRTDHQFVPENGTDGQIGEDHGDERQHQWQFDALGVEFERREEAVAEKIVDAHYDLCAQQQDHLHHAEPELQHTALEQEDRRQRQHQRQCQQDAHVEGRLHGFAVRRPQSEGVKAELFAAAALGVASLHWTAVDHALVVSTLVQVGMTTLLNSAVLLPLNYRFGYEKAKYAFYLMVGLVAALMGFGVSANEDGLARNLLPQGVPPLALLGIVLIVLGLYSLSWRLSVAWYGKAEQ